MGQDSGRGLAGPFWLRVSQEAVIKLSAKAAVSEDLARAGGSKFIPVALGCRLPFLTTWVSPQSCSSYGFPQSEGERGRREREGENAQPRWELQSFYD